MNMRRLLCIASLTIAFAALSPVAAQAATSSSALTGHEVAFRGVVAGVETDDGGFPLVTIQGRGIGFATHLGAFTYTNPHVVDLRTRHGCGSFTVYAGNGDTVTADGCGDATIVSGTPPNAILSIVESCHHHRGYRSLRRRHRQLHRRAHLQREHRKVRRFLPGNDLIVRRTVSDK